jgi:hypothetical protein
MERPKLLKILLAVGMFVGAAPAYFSQIADYGPAQLARQAVVIRTPYLAQMAQIMYSQKNGKQRSGAGPIYMPGAPRSGFRRAPTGSVPRAVASGLWRRRCSLSLAVLARRLNPDLGAPNI